MSESQTRVVEGMYRVEFTRSKRFWGAGVVVQACAGLSGAVLAWVGISSIWTAVCVAVASVVAQTLGHIGARVRNTAEQLLREAEGADSLRWAVDERLLADIAVTSMTAKKTLSDSATYASMEAVGARRAIENARESAWWTFHLTRRMMVLSGVMVLVLFGVCMIALLFVIESSGDPSISNAVAQIVTATLSAVVSAELAWLPFRYQASSSQADLIERRATALLSGTPSKADAFRLLRDYQVARAPGPPIPDRLWRWSTLKLNRAWDAKSSTR